MNKLRELIAKDHQNIYDYQAYEVWLDDHAEAIADLIDAAQSHQAACNIFRCDICEAISKLTEDK